MADEEFLTGNIRGLDVGDGKGAVQEVAIGFVDGTGAFVRNSSSNAIPVSGLGSATLNIASSVYPVGGLTVTEGQVTVASAAGAANWNWIGTPIVAAGTTRVRTLITNLNATGFLFVGTASGTPASSAASSQWFAIPAGTTQTFNVNTGFWGIASSGQVSAAYWTEAP